MINYFVCMVSVLMVVPGCIVGPTQKKPCAPIMKKLSHQVPLQSEQALSQWWLGFRDHTLNSLIEQALSYNYDLAIALEKIEESRALFQLKTGEMFPEIGALAFAAKTRFSQDSPFNRLFGRNGNGTTFFLLGFDAMWEVDIWGKLRRAREAAGYQMFAQIEQARMVHIMLVADVARAYITYVAAVIQQSLLTRVVQIDEELLRLIESRYKAGLDSQLDYLAQEQQTTLSKNALSITQTNVQQSKNQIALLLGLLPDALVLDNTNKKMPYGPTMPQTGLPSELIRRRPDIRKAEREVAASIELTGAAVAEWFPSFKIFGLVGTGGMNASHFFDGGTLSWFIFPSVQWPLINFGRIKANVKAKESAHRAAVLTYTKTVIQAFGEVEDFMVAYVETQKQTQQASERVTSLQKTYELTQSTAVSGLGNTIEQLKSEKNVLLAEYLYVQTQQQTNIQLIGLYKALGGGW